MMNKDKGLKIHHSSEKTKETGDMVTKCNVTFGRDLGTEKEL